MIINMKQILLNLAMIDLINFCKQNKIDCSDTHTYKYPRKYMYSLLKNDTGRTLITVTFHKYAVPSHFISKND